MDWLRTLRSERGGSLWDDDVGCRTDNAGRFLDTYRNQLPHHHGGHEGSWDGVDADAPLQLVSAHSQRDAVPINPCIRSGADTSLPGQSDRDCILRHSGRGRPFALEPPFLVLRPSRGLRRDRSFVRDHIGGNSNQFRDRFSATVPWFTL